MSVTALDTFLEHAAFNALDRQFARRVASETAKGSVLAGHAAAIASVMLRRGHLCAVLDEPPDLGDPLPPILNDWPSLHRWRDDLMASGVVAEDGDTFLPLVLDAQGRLYLHRYFEYERHLAEAIRKRAIDRRFRVIVGGPGTGKTTRILNELVELQSRNPAARVALAAPTGKAAKRMEESIRAGGPNLPKTASTLHRLLGSRSDSAFFKHHAENPLAEDVVIVDEASMVDLPLMSKLLDALKPSAELILVGDPNQLASVEAGAVLADIAEAAQSLAGEATPLGSALLTLKTQHRYGEESGIGQLCESIRLGDGDRAVSLLIESEFQDIRLRPLPSRDSLENAFRQASVIDSLRQALALDDPEKVISAIGRARVLCPMRQGPYGVETINSLIEAALQTEKRYEPIVLTKNDHALQLFNGDSGVIMKGLSRGESWAWFQGSGESYRKIPVIRLPTHETAYAMTVHRSQGSEFDRVLIILPPGQHPVVTRELLYTATSRARRDVEIWGDPQTLRDACSRRIKRHSGLIDRLR
ncbi:MAG: exodeoxyribonuclease V subunit alpha [Gammaproteobacteria bacterium]